MLKFLKSALLILGAIVTLGAIGLILFYFRLSSQSINTIVSAALACKSNQDIHFFDATTTGVLIAAAVALAGGLLLGIGIGLPRRTFKAKLEAQQANDAAEAKEAAEKAAAKAAKDAQEAAEKAAAQAAKDAAKN
ncbi:MAG: hypothetical protein LBN10_10260 [Propionibacteriaceae bacterium]|jgi:hypothetical protein|nr:hypothetical protein [Propionibacteriaceae bacterium]